MVRIYCLPGCVTLCSLGYGFIDPRENLLTLLWRKAVCWPRMVCLALYMAYYGIGVDSASNRNEFQEPSWGVKGSWHVRLMSHNRTGLLDLLQGSFLFLLTPIFTCHHCGLSHSDFCCRTLDAFLCYACYIPQPISLSLIWSSNICLGIKIIKFLVVQLAPSPCQFIPVRCKYSQS
jgi:hypothetical protein